MALSSTARSQNCIRKKQICAPVAAKGIMLQDTCSRYRTLSADNATSTRTQEIHEETASAACPFDLLLHSAVSAATSENNNHRLDINGCFLVRCGLAGFLQIFLYFFPETDGIWHRFCYRPDSLFVLQK